MLRSEEFTLATSCNPMHSDSVCAIIVTYNPTAMLLENIAALRSQVSRLVIVDNGSDSASTTYIDDARRTYGCNVIANGHNLGIAAALNLGVRYAQSWNCEWVLLFDQDSTVIGTFVECMLRAYRRYEGPKPIAIITPRYIDRVSSTPMQAITDRAGNILASMTSGSLIPTRVFRQCGVFDESFFIDYVDHEFCLRVRSMGFVIVQSEGAVLLHSLGNMTFYTFLGKQYITTNHRPERRYYITRNRVWLYRKYLRKDFTWTVKNACGMTKEIGKILLWEHNRVLKLHNVLLGIRDGFTGAMGMRMPL